MNSSARNWIGLALFSAGITGMVAALSDTAAIVRVAGTEESIGAVGAGGMPRCTFSAGCVEYDPNFPYDTGVTCQNDGEVCDAEHLFDDCGLFIQKMYPEVCENGLIGPACTAGGGDVEVVCTAIVFCQCTFDDGYVCVEQFIHETSIECVPSSNCSYRLSGNEIPGCDPEIEA